MSPGYSDDLAYIHHVGYGSFARDAAPGVLEIFRRHDITDGLVVDLGCGSDQDRPSGQDEHVRSNIVVVVMLLIMAAF